MISKEELDKLRKSFELKIKVFDLLKNKKNTDAKKILQEHTDVLSYFMKFKNEVTNRGKIILIFFGGWNINYQDHYENDVFEDLETIRKEIDEAENRLEQNIFLKQQQKFLDLQKQD